MVEAIDISKLLETFGRGRVVRYAAAPAMVALALALREALAPLLPGQTLFLYFVPPVLLAAWIGGLGPGLLATVLSILSALFLIAGAPAISTPVVIDGAAFAAIGIGVSWGGELLRRGRVRTNVMTRETLAREAHLQSILDTVPEAMIVIDERGVMQSFSARGRAAVRLSRRRGDRAERQDPDAGALPRKPRRLSRSAT